MHFTLKSRLIPGQIYIFSYFTMDVQDKYYVDVRSEKQSIYNFHTFTVFHTINELYLTDNIVNNVVQYEPPRGKTNNVVSEQVRHKPACTSTEKR